MVVYGYNHIFAMCYCSTILSAIFTGWWCPAKLFFVWATRRVEKRITGCHVLYLPWCNCLIPHSCAQYKSHFFVLVVGVLSGNQTWRAGKWTVEIRDFPIKTSIDSGFSIAMFNDQRVNVELSKFQNVIGDVRWATHFFDYGCRLSSLFSIRVVFESFSS